MEDHEHVAVAGGMYVADEDLRTVAQMRWVGRLRRIECESCDETYHAKHGWGEW